MAFADFMKAFDARGRGGRHGGGTRRGPAEAPKK
jgi:hypothetical protein